MIGRSPQPANRERSGVHDHSKTERAILAGGCFWGMQDLIRRLPGVRSTQVGYTGGDVPHATYRNHGSHAEAIEIIFDPTVTSYRALLEFFFQIHDPTTKNRQGNDVGRSYRSAIFYLDEEQRRVAGTPSPTSTPPDSGPARWSPRWRRPARSGRRSPSTRTTWSTTRTGTRATTPARVGCCPDAASRCPRARPDTSRDATAGRRARRHESASAQPTGWRAHRMGHPNVPAALAGEREAPTRSRPPVAVPHHPHRVSARAAAPPRGGVRLVGPPHPVGIAQDDDRTHPRARAHRCPCGRPWWIPRLLWIHYPSACEVGASGISCAVSVNPSALTRPALSPTAGRGSATPSHDAPDSSIGPQPAQHPCNIGCQRHGEVPGSSALTKPQSAHADSTDTAEVESSTLPGPTDDDAGRRRRRVGPHRRSVLDGGEPVRLASIALSPTQQRSMAAS